MGVLFQSLVRSQVQKQLKAVVKNQTAKITKATKGGSVVSNVAHTINEALQNPDPSTGLKQGSVANQVYKDVTWNLDKPTRRWKYGK